MSLQSVIDRAMASPYCYPADKVTGVALSADGRWLATAGDYGDKTCRIWDRETGECRILQGHVTSVAISSDGRWVATTEDYPYTCRIWDRETGERHVSLSGHTSSVTSVAFSPDGSWLATASRDKTCRIWDRESGHCLKVLEGHTSSVTSVAISSDGRWLATGSQDDTCRIWDRESGRCLQTLRGRASRVVFSPDGRWLAATEEYCDKSRIWDWGTGACLHILQGHTSSVTGVAISSNGRWLVTGSKDKTCRIWPLELLQRVEVNSSNSISGIAMNSSGRWSATGRADMTYQIGRARRAERLNKWLHGDGSRELTAEGCCLDGAIGLSVVNRRLLEQRGATREGGPLDPPVPQPVALSLSLSQSSQPASLCREDYSPRLSEHLPVESEFSDPSENVPPSGEKAWGQSQSVQHANSYRVPGEGESPVEGAGCVIS